LFLILPNTQTEPDEALAVVHARGIAHRDLKPANIMLTKSGVKVLNFGVAKSAMIWELKPAD
jgi:eukaryotic-like serine/threonine-protein kinase